MYELDRKIVQLSLCSTALFILIAFKCPKQYSKFLNFIFVFIIFISLIILSWRIEKSFSSIPFILIERIFNGTSQRICLLLFWSICVLASLTFSLIVKLRSRSSTVHRKFFHLTVSLICVTGIKYDFQLTWLSAWIVLNIFIITELIRSKDIRPLSVFLNNWLLIFLDEQDSVYLILTPIYLILDPPELYHFAGVLTVGIGDSMASIVGTIMGYHYWPDSRKTIEGSIAFILSQFVFSLLFGFILVSSSIDIIKILFISVLCGILEGLIKRGDNIIVPFIAYLLF
ncbi:unnamed protein product [Dracunculus medinensis]|uniref:dolichol kinase n=1 Tax=Dracunculus medinensis TaxID=318479 RepID=A0A0N4UE03_DRAME|nr:unnamed protein product [Dracunculus medinensis]